MRSAAVDMSAGASVLDPACGAGDLLIACARSLPILPSLEETLQAWGKRLYGRDIHPELVEVAQYRLALLARHCRSEEHTSALKSLMRISSAVFCLKTKTQTTQLQSKMPLQTITHCYTKKKTT